MKTFKKITASLVLTTTIVAYVGALAVGYIGVANAEVGTKYTVLAPLPCIEGRSTDGTVTYPCQGGNGSLQETVDIQGYLQYMYNLVVALASVAAVFEIVWGGFEYVSSAAIQGKTDGKEKIKNALIGLLLILCSFLILRTINPKFVDIPVNLVNPLEVDRSDPFATMLSNMLDYGQSAGSGAITMTPEQKQAYQTAVQSGQTSVNNLNTQQDYNYGALAEVLQANGTDTSGMSNEDILAAAKSMDPSVLGTEGQQLVSDITATQDQIQQTITNTAVTTGKMSIDAVIASCTPPNDPLACTNNDLISARVASFGQSSPEAAAKLADYGQYSTAAITIAQDVAKVQKIVSDNSWSSAFHDAFVTPITGNTSLGNQKTASLQEIDTLVNSYVTKPGADPALVTQLKALQTQAHTDINNVSWTK